MDEATKISQQEKDAIYANDEEVAYVDDKGSVWYWSLGEDYDICDFCGSAVGEEAQVLINCDYAQSRALHPICVGIVV